MDLLLVDTGNNSWQEHMPAYTGLEKGHLWTMNQLINDNTEHMAGSHD